MGGGNSKLDQIYRMMHKLQNQVMNLKEENQHLREELERKRKLREDYPCPTFLLKTKNDINVAIIGQSGSGKSTLVNLLRGIKPGQKGEAKTGPNECTETPQCYTIPKSRKATYKLNKQIYYWDLPGAGTEKYPLETYVQKMGLKWFHAAVLVGDTRYTEVDAKLVNEFKKYAISYLYVRTKMDDQARSQKLKKIPPKKTFEQVRNFLYDNAGIKQSYLIGLTYILKYRQGAWQNKDWKQFQQDLYQEVTVSACAWEKIKQINE